MTQPTTPASKPPRRRFIKLLGGGMVLAAAPLVGCSTGYPSAAVQAWAPASDNADIRRWMLAHALLAPNPHNRQPWIADLKREGEINLVCDAERLLPQTDPFGRQILIGCGAFIELAVMAAAERGHRVSVQTFPAGEPGLNELPGNRVVARLKVERDATITKDPLFAQIRRRHTNKNAFDSTRAVPAPVWAALQRSAIDLGLLTGAVTDAQPMAEVRRLSRQAYEAECVTDRTWLESARLMRIGPTEIETHRDGISLMGTMPRLLSAVGLFDRFEVPKRGTSGYQRTMDRWAAFETGSGYFWLASKGNMRSQQVASGRAYVRAHLHATATGVDMHPLSQALQEFAEVKPQYDALHRLLGFDPATHTVQMLVRVGYGAAAAGPSPRRELGQMLRA
jgi:hypothetical protein